MTAAEAFDSHVARLKISLAHPERFGNPEFRHHHDDNGVVHGGTFLYWDTNDLKPLLIGTVVREHNHTLLIVIDRSGLAPIIHTHVDVEF